MSAQQPGSFAQSSAGGPTRTIACAICDAVYSPSRWHEHLLLAPSIAVESAFMGMCHFCFRCRRPACPECWDEVHGICAQCGRESQLPFRQVVAPLSSLLFTVPRHAQLEREPSASHPLICVAAGTFHDAQLRSVEEIATAPVRAVEQTTMRNPREQWKMMEQKTTQTQDRQTVEPSLQTEIDEMKLIDGRKSTISRNVERLVLIVLCVVLGIVIVLVGLASVFEEVNTFIASTLHVDIRAEIAYLWQLITHLF